MALRRWKAFFPAFGAIDTSIEAAAGGCSRDEYRQVRSDLVEMLCDAADSGDDVRAEQLCRLLDGTMVEALLTLRAVPVPVTPAMLATTGIAKAVGSLLGHESGKVRALARAVVAQWKASNEADRTKVLQMLRELEEAAPVTGGCVHGGPETTVLQADSIKQAAKISDLECPKNKEMSPGRQGQTGDAKRKHTGTGGCYREADDAKRQRKVPEEIVDHRPRKMEPAGKSRSRASSSRSRDERRSSTSTRHRRV